MDLELPTSRGSTSKRRRQILDAALVCFLQEGVSATTIKQIQAKSGASSGSIYHLFRGKDEIALALFLEGMGNYHAKLIRALESYDTARGCIQAIITAHLKNVLEDPALSSYLTRMGVADDLEKSNAQYESLSSGFADAVWSHLKPHVESGEISRLPRNIYFPLIIGPTAFVCRTWLRNRFDTDLLSSADSLIEAAWKSLCPE